MLFLNPNANRIKTAKLTFHIEMRDFVDNRIKTIHKIQGINNQAVLDFFIANILNVIDDILIGGPATLIQLNNILNPIIVGSNDFKIGINHVFNYDLFIKKRKKYDAYCLAQDLDIRTCPYCNRNYTITLIRKDGKKVTRPQFDHYFDKASNPLLAISFFNLIPSCNICNSSIKGTLKMNVDEYLHPYVDNLTHEFRFSYKYSPKNVNGLEVVLVCPTDSKAEKSSEAFALKQIYNTHIAELEELLKVKEYFSERYLSILEKYLLKNIVSSKKEIYRIVFGVEYESEDFINRPFSKFKNDILKELGII
jgi:hypothetical protein